MYGNNQFLRQFIFLIFAVLFFQVDVFADELVAQDELQIAITEMNWASNDQFFLLNNNKTVVVYDSNSLEILDTYKNYNFLATSFFNESDDILRIESVTSDNSLYISSIKQPSISLEEESFRHLAIPFLEEKEIKLADFSKDGNYSAVIYQDNSISLYFRLRYTHQLINRKMEGHKRPIYYLTFSPNGKYFATASDDKKIRIWSTEKNSFETEISFYAKTQAKMDFTFDSSNVLCATGKNELSIKDFNNKKLFSFKTNGLIKDIFARPENKVAILSANNNLEFYDLLTGEYIGMIQSCNSGQVTSVAFSNDSKYVLLGYSDGSAYKINLQEKMILKDQEVPKVRIVEKDEIVVKGYLYEDTFIPTHEYKFSPNANPGSLGVLVDRDHGIKISAGYTALPHPYAAGTRLNLGYVNSDWLYPFYVGVDSRFSFGFPKKDFPYSYLVDETDLSNPFLVSTGLIVPIGIEITPFANGITLLTELSVGCVVHFLWNAQFSQTSVMGKPYPAFVASVSVGGGYKGISLKINGDYDSQLGFLFSADLGFQINLPDFQKGGRK